MRHKKEAKIMNWAKQEEDEADDLFSNCSSKRKSTLALKEVNEDLRSKKAPPSQKVLPTISE